MNANGAPESNPTSEQPSVDESGASAVVTVTPPSPLQELARYLYNSNPFYALSATLILVGLHLMCKDESVLTDPHSIAAAGWLHLSLLAGYTILVAGTGVVVVRIAGVWEDARTILLSVLLLLVATSVEFDHLLLTKPTTAKAVLCIGGAFALLLVEATIRGARVRVPLGYRLPLLAALTLFFLYPVLLLTVLDEVGFADNRLGREGTRWLVFLFPAAAAIIALTLLPAAARGPAYVADNGTPWKWPWYPWPVFVFLAVGVCFRAYYLTLTFDPQAKFESAFGLYFLTPFLIATGAVVFEAARSSGSSVGQSVALVAPLTLVLTALPGDDGSPAYRSMLQSHTDALGPPVLIACWGLVLQYGYAVLRGVHAAWAGVAAMLALAAFIGPSTIDFGSFMGKPAMWPFVGLTAIGAGLAFLEPRNSARWGLLAFAVIGTGLSATRGDFLSFLEVGAAVTAGCSLAVLLGVAFKDAFAEIAGQGGALGLLIASFYLTFSGSTECLNLQTNGSALAFALAVTAILFAVAKRLRSDYYHALGVLSLIPVAVRALAHLAAAMRLLRNPTAVGLVIGGAASFLLGAAITAVKAGWNPFGAGPNEPGPPQSPDASSA
jgi:hypothetical protein